MSFDQAAGRFLEENAHLASIDSTVHHLKAVMPYIGELSLDQVHMGTLRDFIEARLEAGRAHKTINLSLAAVRRVLNLAAGTWRDHETGKPWLQAAPMITLLPLTGHQRSPRPISWNEQEALVKELPEHLRRMAIFVLNTGVRDDVVCNLQWDWEIPVPDLGVSVFEVPAENVKGRRTSKLVVCNSVTQPLIEELRGIHPTHVFAMAWSHHELGPVQTMNNTAWQAARRRARLGDLHVHDLRHTVGMRLREAGVNESTRSDVLWHSARSITNHYSMAQIREIHEALEKITRPSNGWNKSLQALKAEHAARKATAGPGIAPGETESRKSPAGRPAQRKTG
ncbi:MAG: tyrosine-type recombinase/integrase [Hydrogenophaga sp.]|uniref:tyrosine-type recombinase/integrase n=1 Tax=Hydrogenophaga sp. TaxID=1904254 RepID=UPI001D530D47|nr:tyrosine-type recombinase/integrase [Hydrogenophaga sp.]MBX3610761.1 tyrosine-type recombinase/integrase [Hydrogenophaga sp.]